MKISYKILSTNKIAIHSTEELDEIQQMLDMNIRNIGFDEHNVFPAALYTDYELVHFERIVGRIPRDYLTLDILKNPEKYPQYGI